MLEFYEPTIGPLSKEKQYFTVRVSVSKNDLSAAKIDLTTDFRITIDYFDIIAFGEHQLDQWQLDMMREEFNLPLGSGCSESVTKVNLDHIEAQTFSLGYKVASSSETEFYAYDHENRLLRKDVVGRSVSIWDLNEDLLYHINKDSFRYQDSNKQLCSVSQVRDIKLSRIYRPYDTNGRAFDVLNMLGAKNIAFMGKGRVRDLSCLIYETILPSPPPIFASAVTPISSPSKVDFIVQFHLLEDNIPTGSKEHELSERNFWPAKITLFRRVGTKIDYIDHLDIYDFYWSLEGWPTKQGAMFMASECFDEDDEQIRTELSIVFRDVHDGSSREAHRLLMSYNKFKLEADLIKDITSDIFKISPMHLVEYELKFRPNHLTMEMVLADRSAIKELLYFGTGSLPDTDVYSQNRIDSQGNTEESCVLSSSLIIDASFVVYCPPTADQDSLCTAVYGGIEPVIEQYVGADSTKPVCRVYRFLSAFNPIKSLQNVRSKSSNLYDHKVSFAARLPEDRNQNEVLEGLIKDYDLRQQVRLVVVSNYKFFIDPFAADKSSNKNVRSFDYTLGETYESEGDCARVCHLDATCRSYSYCSSKVANRCIVSTLDVRASKVQDQLVNSLAPENGTALLSVSGQQGTKFDIELADRCNIYERNYLNIFRETSETVRLKYLLSYQFKTTPTPFDCAKESVDLELADPEHHVAMFAYCGQSKTCLLDENLFKPVDGDWAAEDTGTTTRELICQVYRKKYQTYFKLSGHVLKRKEEQQVEVALASVEECARACWNQYGQVCASFDFCPNTCLINKVSAESSGVELEVRSKCLHYERDANLDKLKRLHMIGRQKLLDVVQTNQDSWTRIVTILTTGLALIAFVYGLALGHRVNDKLEAVSVHRQSVSAGSGVRASPFLFQRFSPEESKGDRNGQGNQTGIRMDVFKGPDRDFTPLEEDF